MLIRDVLGLDVNNLPQDELEELVRTGRLAREAEAAPKQRRTASKTKSSTGTAGSLAIFDEDDL